MLSGLPADAFLPLVGLTILMGVAALTTDLHERRIPNWLTIGGFTVALALRAVGPESVSRGLGGAGLAFAIALLLFLIGAIGGGDVKLLAAMGAALGTERILPGLLVTGLLGGALAVGVAFYYGRALDLVGASGRLALHVATLGRYGERRTLVSPDSLENGPPPVPYGVAVAIGCTVVWFF